MKCPNCPESVLVMTDRSGIEIDYCPKCRGVWLDRGELDKLIERSAGAAVSNAAPSSSSPRAGVSNPQRPRYDDDDDDRRSKDGYGFKKPYKKKSLLGELFDF